MLEGSADAPRDAVALAAAIRSGEISAREAVEDAIARIEKHNPALNAVVGFRFEEALDEVEAGLPEGPLTGVPVLIKNLGADVAGLPSTSGSRLFANYVPEHDSELVRRYRQAGMVVLGTTNTPELGLNASTEPALFGPTHNPHRRGFSPGGSSGGSAAAVAGGMVPVAHASDGGGSIRIPAAMCGLFGLKPSRGRVTGFPDPGTLAGPVSVNHALTTTVRDSALLLDIAAGPMKGEAFSAPAPRTSFLDATRRDPGRLRIGMAVKQTNGPETDAECVAAVERVATLCERLGHEVTETDCGFDYAEAATTSATAMGTELVVAIDDWLAFLGRELRDDDLEPFTHFLLEQYRRLSGADVTRAMRGVQEIGWKLGTKFDTFDVLLTPTLARPTPEHGVLDTGRAETMYESAPLFSCWTSPFNVTGMPAMSLPLAADQRGMPLGVQFAADLGGEELLLSLAAQLEQASPWRRLASGYAK
ncbi:amidase [Sphaerimonospora thailandensis]|uniref:Amidase n=1 Tax=Sphaerimonospora thailandensis TaxID=795644 RepID=A0A8J3R846_9ACTN|nr:amidase [Sphaerimonospora thailandensis]